MKAIKRILCVLDPYADEQRALARTQFLASRCGAHVVLLATVRKQAVNPHVDALGVALDQYQSDLEKALNKQLAREAKELGDHGVTAEALFAWHRSLTDTILGTAERFDADLIIKDTRYHSAIQRALYTDTDRQLIRTTTVPLWLVRQATNVENRGRVVACIDPMQEDSAAQSAVDHVLATGAWVATTLGGTLEALHVNQPLTTLGAAAEWSVGPRPLATAELLTAVENACREQLDLVCRRYDIAPERRHLVSGSVGEVLAGSLTELGAGVAVLSRNAPTTLDKAILGSTAESILDHAPCDLLLLPG